MLQAPLPYWCLPGMGSAVSRMPGRGGAQRIQAVPRGGLASREPVVVVVVVVVVVIWLVS